MSHTWKLLPLAALFALGLFLVLPVGQGTKVPAAFAEVSCEDTARLRIEIVDDDTSARITVAGSVVSINPDPTDGTGTRNYTDNGTNDDSDTVGRIDEAEACFADDDDYTITLTSLPAALDDCQIIEDTIVTGLAANVTVTFHVEDCPDITPTVTVTTTPAAAATVTGSSNPTSVACGGTSIISFTVKNAAGNAVPANTAITFTTTLGTLSPTTGTTASDGSVFVFFTAPSNQGGSATITATAPNNAKGTATVQVNCGQAQATATSTTSPPPTVAATATPAPIRPPSTGDAGLDEGRGWTPYAGIALIAVSILGTLVVVRSRA